MENKQTIFEYKGAGLPLQETELARHPAKPPLLAQIEGRQKLIAVLEFIIVS